MVSRPKPPHRASQASSYDPPAVRAVRPSSWTDPAVVDRPPGRTLGMPGLEGWMVNFLVTILAGDLREIHSIPSGKHTKSYRKMAIGIVDFAIKHGDFL